MWVIVYTAMWPVVLRNETECAASSSAQSAKDRARLERQSSSSGGSREEDNLRVSVFFLGCFVACGKRSVSANNNFS